jgi:hypothetical protein
MDENLEFVKQRLKTEQHSPTTRALSTLGLIVTLNIFDFVLSALMVYHNAEFCGAFKAVDHDSSLTIYLEHKEHRVEHLTLEPK